MNHIISRKRMIRRKRLADRMDVHPVTIDRMVKRGLLPPPIKLGGGYSAWFEEEIEERLATQRQHEDAE